jgi:hypothetical protein
VRAACALLLLTACGQPPELNLPPSEDPIDGGAGELIPAALELSVGTGQRGVLAPWVDGQGLVLQRGCQGSQHIFTSFRVVNASAGLVRTRISVVRVTDGVLVSVPIDVRLPLERDPLQMAEAGVITGLTPVIEVPRDVLGQNVEIRVELEDALGAKATGSVRGVVSWGADGCGSHG